MSSFSKANSTLIETINYSDIMDMGFSITILNKEDETVKKIASQIGENDNYHNKVYISNAIYLKSGAFNLIMVNYSLKSTSRYSTKKMESKIYFSLLEN